MREGGRDAVSGGVLLILAAALLLVIPDQVETLEADTLTPAFLPTLLAWIILLLSAGLLFSGVRELGLFGGERRRLPLPKMRGMGAVASVASVLAAYVAAIPILGYLLSTGLAAGALSYLYGHRARWQIAALMVLTPPVVFYFFRFTMLVLLPQGSLFE